MTQGRMDHIEIPATDAEASARFYESVFGWRIDRSMPQYVMFGSGPGAGGAFVTGRTPATGAGVLPYVTVTSIEETLAKVESAGGARGQARSPIVEGESWWATFTDVAGNEIGLYESKTSS